MFSLNFRSHFRGSLRQPHQATSSIQMSSLSTTLPSQVGLSSSYHSRNSSTSTDGTPSLEQQPATFTSPPIQKESTLSVTTQCTHSVSQPEEITCWLCEETVDVQLIPCNHLVLCSIHAKTSKKCPQCRVSSLKDLRHFIISFNTETCE